MHEFFQAVKALPPKSHTPAVLHGIAKVGHSLIRRVASSQHCYKMHNCRNEACQAGIRREIGRAAPPNTMVFQGAKASRLSDPMRIKFTVPEAEQCGWAKDKYGVSWQIIAANMGELMSRNLEKRTPAMLAMKKIIIADLEEAGREVEGGS